MPGDGDEPFPAVFIPCRKLSSPCLDLIAGYRADRPDYCGNRLHLYCENPRCGVRVFYKAMHADDLRCWYCGGGDVSLHAIEAEDGRVGDHWHGWLPLDLPKRRRPARGRVADLIGCVCRNCHVLLKPRPR